MAATDAPTALAMPPTADMSLLVVGLVAVSTSGPIIAATAAPALAIAFWRNAMATGVLVPVALTRARAEIAALTTHERALATAAGVLLAAHFATWVPSLTYTSVASATALVSTQPVWAALLAHRAGHRVPPVAWAGIVIAVVGAGLIAGVDVTTSGRALVGDVLAALGGMFAAAYMVAGGRVRQTVSTTTYTTMCYATTSLTLLVVCVAAGVSLSGYSADTWLKLISLTVGAQLLGHSMFNRVLRTTSPTVVSLAILFEVPGATLLAAVWLDQRLHVAAIPGLVLLITGIAVVIVTRTRAMAPAIPVE